MLNIRATLWHLALFQATLLWYTIWPSKLYRAIFHNINIAELYNLISVSYRNGPELKIQIWIRIYPKLEGVPFGRALFPH